MIIHKIIHFCIEKYIKNEDRHITSSVVHDSNSYLSYPSIVEHGELIRLGSNTCVLNHARLQVYPQLVEKTPHIVIGNDVYIGYRFTALACSDITIGNKVMIADDVLVVSYNHKHDIGAIAIMDQGVEGKTIKIGNNVWIGAKSIILAGSEIGDNVIVGAGTVVNKKVPSNSIAIGNPCRVIKKFDNYQKKWIRTDLE